MNFRHFFLSHPVYKVSDIHLKFQRSDVSNSEFSFRCQLYRPDGGVKTRNLAVYGWNSVK